MPGIDTLITFSLAAFLLCIAPGPSNLYIMARSISQGHQAGIAAAGGMAIGSFIYTLATALGLAAVFQYMPLAYTLLKLGGAAYLIYLGYQYFVAVEQSIEQRKVAPAPNARIFKQSVLVELTNPKTALFFLAFLPQFVDLQAGSVVMQLVVLGTVYAFIGFGSDIFVAFMSGKLGKWLTMHPQFVRLQDKFSGSLLMGLGAYITVEEVRSH